ncbi:MAG: GDSL-type esterase/lipase family protein [Nitrospinota bacterium]
MAGVYLPLAAGLFGAALLGLVPPALAAPAPPRDCGVAESFYAFEPPLPKTIRALRSGGETVIAAVGGASTLGRAAGGREHAWPARLSEALVKRIPAARVKMVNLGVPRQTAREAAARLEREVIPLKPALVIWETGTMEAVRGADIEDFRETVQEGVGRLRAAGAEVVLMDMQFSRRSSAVIDFESYLAVLRQLADAIDVPLFPRHSIMHHWAESGQIDLAVTDPEKRRLVAIRLYDCLGREMADFVTRGSQLPGAAPGSGR